MIKELVIYSFFLLLLGLIIFYLLPRDEKESNVDIKNYSISLIITIILLLVCFYMYEYMTIPKKLNCEYY